MLHVHHFICIQHKHSSKKDTSLWKLSVLDRVLYLCTLIWTSDFQNHTKESTLLVQILDLKEFVKSSSNNLRLKPTLSTLYSRNEVRKHLEKKDFKNAWKVSRFFAFFYDAFLVYLQCLEETFKIVIKSCSGGWC